MSFYTFLPKLLNMSLTASVVIVFVLLLRLLLKRAPKVISYALWGIVLIRLLCPVSIESNFSLFGLMDAPVEERGELTSSIEYVPNNIVHTEYPTVVLPVPGVSDVINDALPKGEEQLIADPLEAPIFLATYAWIAGVLGMAIYAAVSYVRLRRKLFTAIHLRDNIWSADGITSPFVMGLFRPKIYLPNSMEQREQSYIILHEQYHIRRFDHVIKAISFVALCIHWFNPLVWVAFIMAGKDMEMSCDEAVVKKMGESVLADYTASLLSLATGKHIIAGMPLAFGEGDTKGRIRNLANWKKPAFWVVLVAVIACVVLAVCLLTNPSDDELHAPEPFSHSYKVEEILYSAPQYSFAYSTDTAPRYQFTSDYVMFVSENGFAQDGPIEWVQQNGGFEEVKITTENFDNYFNMSGFQISNDRWSKFRTNIKRAWRIDIENDENNVFYYLISTKSGEVYLTYGYHDPEGETDPHSDDSSIRWLFKLARTDLLTCNAISEGIDAFVGLTCFPGEIDRDTDNWPVAQINESGILQFSLEGDINALVVSEDYYRKDGNSTFIERNSFEVGRDDDGFFRIDVARRESLEDHVNYFIKIKGQSDVYTMKIVFVDNNHGDIDDATGSAPVVLQWFDYSKDSGAYANAKGEMPHEAFPGVTFRYGEYQIVASKGSEDNVLISGMPIWNAYFTDLTGDGLPDICATLSIGSGMIDNRIIIYDYANGVSYELQDRGNYDYSLSLQGDRLMVTKRVYNSEEIVETGYLAYEDETVTIIPMEIPSDTSHDLEQAITKAILDHYASEKPDGLIHVESHVLLANEVVSGTPLFGQDDHVKKETVYLLVLHLKYSAYGGVLEERGGSYVPTALTFSVSEDGSYTLEEYWEPRDGAYNADDVRGKFPGASADDALIRQQDYIDELNVQCYQKALAYMESIGGADERIGKLLDEITSSPATSSNPGDYIAAHDAEYQELLSYGEFSLRYCFEQFLQGGQTDLRGHIMAIACREIAVNWGEAILMWDSEPPIEAQAWFDAFLSSAQSLAQQYSSEDMEKYYPASWLLLQMIEEKNN